jgi:hypothetical protein
LNRIRILVVSAAAAACLAGPGSGTGLAAAHPSAAHPGTGSAASSAPAGAADPAPGDGTVPLSGPAVVVFDTEALELSLQGTKLSIYPDPSGCYQFPLGGHVLDNLTNQTVYLYLDPFCTIRAPLPFNNLAPGYGAHISPVGSFEVG